MGICASEEIVITQPDGTVIVEEVGPVGVSEVIVEQPQPVQEVIIVDNQQPMMMMQQQPMMMQQPMVIYE